MRATEIRRRFLEFFRERGHKVWPSSSLVPEDPRAPLLTTAGMVQFIPYFFGERPIDNPRAASCQRSARTTDIELVGRTGRHMTTFEMLGNWSFGDYFKKEAIEWAWELTTSVFGLDPDRIWASVYETDDESADIWETVVGLPRERIVRLGFDDNFWWMGVPGPGGPCSELYYDRGPRYGDASTFEEGERTERIMEFWNLVFMQHEVDATGAVVRDLPQRSVDTGMGLERMATILQDVPTIWETDDLRAMIARAEDLTGRRYGNDERSDVSLRILAEHARAASFLIGDGILPANDGRGYILRRLIRRAVRHARLLGTDDPVLPGMIDAVVARMGEPYPEVASGKAFITQVAGAEEEHFRATLARGLTMLEDEIGGTRSAGSRALAGDVAFKLHDTYGFPFELTLEIAQEAGLEIDRGRFDVLMDEQRERARAARKDEVEGLEGDALREVLRGGGPTTFVGYDRDAEGATVLALLSGGSRVREAREGDEVEVVLDVTPFYPEGGGQIGDRGVIVAGDARLEVTDTRKRLGELIVHSARVVAGGIAEGVEAEARVDAAFRASTMRSHTATHVVHAVLRRTLGEHARQAGSLVEPGRLRFDFSHFQSVPAEVLAAVEREVNDRLLSDELVRPYETTMDEARNRGALALFEEKYGDIVRVVEIGDWSVELCGGTHVTHTSQVGAVKLLGEASIGSNLRRIEALTGAEAIEDFRRSRAVLEHVAALLRSTPEDAPAKVEKMLADLRSAEAEIRKARRAGEQEQAGDLAGRATDLGGARLLIEEVSGLPMGELQGLATTTQASLGDDAAVVLVSSHDGKAAIVAKLGKALTGRLKARDLIADAARAIGGGAGGRDDFAQGGGGNVGGTAEAVRIARQKATEVLR